MDINIEFEEFGSLSTIGGYNALLKIGKIIWFWYWADDTGDEEMVAIKPEDMEDYWRMWVNDSQIYFDRLDQQSIMLDIQAIQ